LDVVLDLVGDLVQAVHVEDLSPDLVLIVSDVLVGVDLLRPQVVDDLHGALAEDVALEDVGQTRLRVHRENEDIVALLREPERGRRGKGRLAEPSLPPEHHVPSVRVFAEHGSERAGAEGLGERPI
jgi:hypothetical protein